MRQYIKLSGTLYIDSGTICASILTSPPLDKILKPVEAGYESEPEDLTEKRQRELIVRYQQGDSDAADQLLMDYDNMIRGFYILLTGKSNYIRLTPVIKRFLSMFSMEPSVAGNISDKSNAAPKGSLQYIVGLAYSIRRQISRSTPLDIWQELILGFLEICQRYEPRKVPVRSYIAKMLAFHVKKVVMSHIKSMDNYTVDLIDPQDIIDHKTHSVSQKEGRTDDIGILSYYMKDLNLVETEIFRITVIEGHTIKEAAEQLHVSEYYAGTTNRRVKKLMREICRVSGSLF